MNVIWVEGPRKVRGERRGNKGTGEREWWEGGKRGRICGEKGDVVRGKGSDVRGKGMV